MNILFLSLLDFESLDEKNIYTDLLREFRRRGHNLYVVSPMERRKKKNTFLIEEDNCLILKLKIGNVQKTNYIEKGISLLTLQGRFIHGIIRNFRNVRFDLVLYATPPITLQKVVKYVKNKWSSATYLLLKDIWPQGIVDLGILSSNNLVCRYFRKKEKDMYVISDYIGCMSQANVQYVKEHNSYIKPERVEICPNCIEPTERKVTVNKEEQRYIQEKYGIPQNKTVFVYGGNLGKPQGIDFIIECIKGLEQLDHIFVLIIGSGTEYDRLAHAIANYQLKNTKLESYIPQKDYKILLQVCHVGLIFLDHRFTIPNFPSRLLAYMDAHLPVLAIVDSATDVGQVVENGNFGWSCKSENATEVIKMFDEIGWCSELNKKGENGRAYLQKHYSAKIAYQTIISHFLEK